MTESQKSLSLNDLEFFPVAFVRRGTPAMDVFRRLCEHPKVPGRVFFLSDEEFDSLKADVLLLKVENG